MGTRSNIIVQRRDGMVAVIYCHWDGYLSHNGAILQEHYNSQEKAEALVALGDISALGEEIGEKHDFDWRMTFLKRYDNDYDGMEADPEYRRLRRMCLAYHRDRGEAWKDVKPDVFANTASAWPDSDTWAEFVYVWSLEHQRWFVAGAHEGTQALVPLDYALQNPESVDANVIVPWLGIVGKHHAQPRMAS